MAGRILGGTYRLVRLIGTGGMGAVWESEHLRLPRKFAVKVLHKSVAFDPEVVQRFRREAEIASSLGSPHIVEVIDFNVDTDGTPYLVMELLRGENLGDRVKKTGPWSVQKAARMIDQVAGALQAAHDKGIIHRDLKPQNLFLTTGADGHELFKVVDFGISKVLHSASLRTNQGSVFGTPQYMAPEQALGQTDRIDARTDVYALGMILWEVLAGRPPYTGTNIAELIFKVLNEAPPSLSAVVPQLPADLCDVVGCALAKKPEERFQTMRALRDAFVRAAERAPAQPSRIPPTRAPMPRPTSPAAEALEEPMRAPSYVSIPSGTAATMPAEGSAAAVETVKPEPRSRSGLALVALGAGLIVVAGVVAWVWQGAEASDPSQAMPPGMTAAPFFGATPAPGMPGAQFPATGFPATAAPLVPVPVATALPATAAATSAPSSSRSRSRTPRTTSPGPIEDTLGP